MMNNPLVKNKHLIVSLPLFLAASLLLPSYVVPMAHASPGTGLVCVTASASATGCPASPPALGPFTVGQTFTVGLFVQGSDAMGGWDIMVQADPAFVSPVSAALGTLVANPSLTSICVNGLAQTGACTVGYPNGPGAVEATTIDSSGDNECGGISPCSGMALTITYQVVRAIQSTPLTYPVSAGAACSSSSVASPPNTCVLVADAFGTILSENIQGATVTQTVIEDPTSTSVACAPNPVSVGQSTTCTATVTDTALSNPTSPSGTVTFTTDGSGVFQPTSSCILQSMPGQPKSNCFVNYLPFQLGLNNICGIYSGELSHTPSSGCFPLIVSNPPVNISTVIIIDQTGQPVGASLPFGYTYHDEAIMSGGAPPQGVSGTVTYTLYTSTTCTGTGTVISTVNVGASDDVPPSTSVKPAAGSYGINARYNGDGNNNAVTSPCEPLTITAAPTFTGGKVSWTHHLSLSKSSNAQTYTAKVANPLSTSVTVVVRITGASTSNPSMNFDVTCGTICVNKGDYASINQAAAAAGPVSVAAGASSFSFSFSQPISGAFIGQKVSFTATLYWSTGTVYLSSSTKTGAFAVVP